MSDEDHEGFGEILRRSCSRVLADVELRVVIPFKVPGVGCTKRFAELPGSEESPVQIRYGVGIFVAENIPQRRVAPPEQPVGESSE